MYNSKSSQSLRRIIRFILSTVLAVGGGNSSYNLSSFVIPHIRATPVLVVLVCTGTHSAHPGVFCPADFLIDRVLLRKAPPWECMCIILYRDYVNIAYGTVNQTLGCDPGILGGTFCCCEALLLRLSGAQVGASPTSSSLTPWVVHVLRTARRPARHAFGILHAWIGRRANNEKGAKKKSRHD